MNFSSSFDHTRRKIHADHQSFEADLFTFVFLFVHLDVFV